ncbi:outer membrane beta-barrel protein [Novispirillum sp. DQ9]|uniref:outer membrane beta-barrel protein n=1 Tax=Novispirillum sp. DQ9 TaxID=3398612 RepID=UPI003C79C9D2
MYKTRLRPAAGRTRRAAALTAMPLVLALATLAAPAVAQEDIPRGATVMDRERPEVDPLGVQLGGFFVFPSLGVSGSYDDNVFATATNEREDFLTVVAPTVTVESTWSVHELNLGTGARVGRYADYDSEDFEDYFVNADGTFEFTPRSNLNGTLAFNRLHEGRGDPDVGATPDEFNLTEAGLRFFQGFNRVSAEVEGTVEHFDYDSPAGTANRDIAVYTTSLRGDYMFADEYGAFARLTGNWREPGSTFRTFGAAPRYDRTSNGWQADIGMTFDLTGVTFGEVFAGYREQYFSDSRLDDVNGLSFGAEIVNNFTRLTTFTGRAESSIEETTALGASSYLQNSFSLEADHELRRNILLHAGATYETYEYQGVDRDADRWGGSVGATWLANRHMHFDASYTYTDHSEAGVAAANDWNRNLVMLGLTLHL